MLTCPSHDEEVTPRSVGLRWAPLRIDDDESRAHEHADACLQDVSMGSVDDNRVADELRVAQWMLLGAAV
jgi:hypothetical protein